MFLKLGAQPLILALEWGKGNPDTYTVRKIGPTGNPLAPHAALEIKGHDSSPKILLYDERLDYCVKRTRT